MPTNLKDALKNAELRSRIHEAYEIYAGMDGFIPMTAPEGYCLQTIKKMADELKPPTPVGLCRMDWGGPPY